jgi:hypothetical protein
MSPGEDVARAGVEIGNEEGLLFELAFGIAHEHQRIGMPPRYHSAVLLVISTMRLAR